MFGIQSSLIDDYYITVSLLDFLLISTGKIGKSICTVNMTGGFAHKGFRNASISLSLVKLGDGYLQDWHESR